LIRHNALLLRHQPVVVYVSCGVLKTGRDGIELRVGWDYSPRRAQRSRDSSLSRVRCWRQTGRSSCRWRQVHVICKLSMFVCLSAMFTYHTFFILCLLPLWRLLFPNRYHFNGPPFRRSTISLVTI